MDQDRLKEWVENKLESGVDRDRIKKSLEETGHDPGIVDSIEDPFEDVGEEDAEYEDDSEEMPHIDSEEEDEDGIDLDPDDKDTVEKDEEQDNSQDSTGRDYSSILPGISRKPDLSKRALLGSGILVLLIGIVAAGIYIEPGIMDTDIRDSMMGDSQPEEADNCPNVGILINSVSSSTGSTTAEVSVLRGEAEVVLEVYQDGQKLGETTDSFQGQSSMTVNQVGDEAVLRLVECPSDYVDRRPY